MKQSKETMGTYFRAIIVYKVSLRKESVAVPQRTVERLLLWEGRVHRIKYVFIAPIFFLFM